MADLDSLQSSETVRIVGSDATGVEQAPVQSTVNGGLHSNLRNASGAEIGTVTAPVRVDPTGTTTQPISATSLTSIDSKIPTIGQKAISTSAPVVNPSEAANNSAIPGVSILAAGSDGTNIRPLAVDNLGRLVTSAITGFGANFIFGDISTAAVTSTKVERTMYLEQAVNGQRSVSSLNPNDTALGTGARSIKITYLDQTGVGPFTEVILLNGITAVNTVATNICFIEKMEITNVGTTGSNAGVVSLKTMTAGAGMTIGSIAALDNQTFWSHHYVPVGKTCNITGASVSHSGTTVGSGGVFVLKGQILPIANQVDLQISDFVRLYGQASTSTRNYGSPIKIVGPARITSYVTPETTTATVYRASVDFFEP